MAGSSPKSTSSPARWVTAATLGTVEAEIVIPPGEVCDKCNGWRLSRVDGALVEIAAQPISVFRSLGQIRNRRRRLVDAVAGTRWRLELDADDPREFLLSATADTSRVSGRDDVARALCKIALETRWLQDPVDARSSRWDLVALAAIGGPLPESLAMGLTQPAGIDDIDFRPETILRVHPIAPWLVGQVSVAGLRLSLVIGSPPPAVPPGRPGGHSTRQQARCEDRTRCGRGSAARLRVRGESRLRCQRSRPARGPRGFRPIASDC